MYDNNSQKDGFQSRKIYFSCVIFQIPLLLSTHFSIQARSARYITLLQSVLSECLSNDQFDVVASDSYIGYALLDFAKMLASLETLRKSIVTKDNVMTVLKHIIEKRHIPIDKDILDFSNPECLMKVMTEWLTEAFERIQVSAEFNKTC